MRGPFEEDKVAELGSYFAFVESIEPIASASEVHSSGMHGVFLQRDKAQLAPPTHIVWLDCIREAYFRSLSWKDEPCPIGDAESARARRTNLVSLEENQFVAVFLLLSTALTNEATVLQALMDADWHSIEIGQQSGMPASVATDFEAALEDPNPTIRYINYAARCEGDEMRWLRNVFSLDFLPDADFGESDRGNTPPDKSPNTSAPPPWGGGRSMVDHFQEPRQDDQDPSGYGHLSAR
jgi:hypothetical protein